MENKNENNDNSSCIFAMFCFSYFFTFTVHHFNIQDICEEYRGQGGKGARPLWTWVRPLQTCLRFHRKIEKCLIFLFSHKFFMNFLSCKISACGRQLMMFLLIVCIMKSWKTEKTLFFFLFRTSMNSYDSGGPSLAIKRKYLTILSHIF